MKVYLQASHILQYGQYLHILQLEFFDSSQGHLEHSLRTWY
jgi:hypothetical protein